MFPRWALRWWRFPGAMLLALAASSAGVFAAERLRERVDRLVEGAFPGPVAGVCGDGDFLRRVYLDLTGVIPSADVARAFLNDPAADKRAAVVERLLATPEHARHLAISFDVMLMERRADQAVPNAAWRKYLQESFAANKPYDQLVREILAADGADPKLRAAAKFYLDREAEPHLVTRDVSRMFFGRDHQCAQCHDHPLVDDYLQADYYGLYAFVTRSSLFKGPDNVALLAEKADGEPSYVSAFDRTKTQHQGEPHVPGGEAVADTKFKPGDEYVVKPAAKVRPVPKYSRRVALATQTTTTNNRAFQRNIVNRLWALTMGQGLVDPVDMHHSGNPAVHVELLEVLASEFAAAKYDVRWLLRELVLSRTYQRAIDLPENVLDVAVKLAPQREAWTAERDRLVAAAEKSQAALEETATQLVAARNAMSAAAKTASEARQQWAKLQQAFAENKTAAAVAQADVAGKGSLVQTLGEIAAKAADAAKQLPQDKELAGAAEKFRQRHGELQQQLAAAQAMLTQRQAAAKTAGDQLAATEQAATTAEAKLKSANEEIARLQARRTELSRGAEQARAAAQQATDRVTDLEALLAVSAKSQQATAAQETITAADVALRAAREKLAVDGPQWDQAQQKLADAESAAKKLQADVAAKLTRSIAFQADADVVGQAVAKSEQALLRLAGDAELTAAVTALRKRHAALVKQAQDEQTAVAAAQQAHQTAVSQRQSAAQGVAKLQTERGARTTAVAACEQACQAARKSQEGLAAEVESARKKLAERASRRFALGRVRGLTPEQFGWSVLQATGQLAVQRTAAEAEWTKKNDKASLADPAVAAARATAVEQQAYDKLAGNAAVFLPLFAASAGQPQYDFFATADQALFLSNGGAVRGWLAPGGGNVTERMVKQTDPQQVAEELYLTILTRPPTAEESRDVTQYLSGRDKDRPIALQELAWALLTASEFRFQR